MSSEDLSPVIEEEGSTKLEDYDPAVEEKISAKFEELCTSWAASNREFDDTFIDQYFGEIQAFSPRPMSSAPSEWHASVGFGRPDGGFDRILINRAVFTSITSQGTKWAIGGKAHISGPLNTREHTYSVKNEKYNIIRIIGTGPFGRVEFVGISQQRKVRDEGGKAFWGRI